VEDKTWTQVTSAIRSGYGCIFLVLISRDRQVSRAKTVRYVTQMVTEPLGLYPENQSDLKENSWYNIPCFPESGKPNGAEPPNRVEGSDPDPAQTCFHFPDESLPK